MEAVKQWMDDHPTIWEFIKFNLLSNCATVTSFIVMWVCTSFIFAPFRHQPFQFLIFHYTTEESLMLCGFLSFLTATAIAQVVNFFIQKNLVFQSDAGFGAAAPRFLTLAVVLVIISVALPAYSQELLVEMGVSKGFALILANVVNLMAQVAIGYPAIKFWVMPSR